MRRRICKVVGLGDCKEDSVELWGGVRLSEASGSGGKEGGREKKGFGGMPSAKLGWEKGCTPRKE